MTEVQRKKFTDACFNGQMDVIESMLKDGFDVNYFRNGDTPLQRACTQTKPWVVDVVTKLITHGAVVDADTNEHCTGWTSLNFCLISQPFQRHVAQLLLDCSKLGVNHLDILCKTYLWYANTLEACKFLVDNGIEVNVVDKFGHTALDDKNVLEICSYLISVGAKEASEL